MRPHYCPAARVSSASLSAYEHLAAAARSFVGARDVREFFFCIFWIACWRAFFVWLGFSGAWGTRYRWEAPDEIGFGRCGELLRGGFFFWGALGEYGFEGGLASEIGIGIGIRYGDAMGVSIYRSLKR